MKGIRLTRCSQENSQQVKVHYIFRFIVKCSFSACCSSRCPVTAPSTDATETASNGTVPLRAEVSPSGGATLTPHRCCGFLRSCLRQIQVRAHCSRSLSLPSKIELMIYWRRSSSCAEWRDVLGVKVEEGGGSLLVKSGQTLLNSIWFRLRLHRYV